jgi:hypothetical protein
MAYHNTGYARKKTLTVTKGSYTQSYDLCAAFTSPKGNVYTALSNDAFARLSDPEYEARRADFIDYVYELEDGLETDCPDLTVGSVVYDPTSCPLPNN